MVNREADFEALRNDVDALRKDLAKLVRHVNDDQKDKMGDMKNRLRTMVEDLEERAKEGISTAYSASRAAGEKALARGREEINKRPFTMTLISFLVGIGAGLCIRRRR